MGCTVQRLMNCPSVVDTTLRLSYLTLALFDTGSLWKVVRFVVLFGLESRDPTYEYVAWMVGSRWF